MHNSVLSWLFNQCFKRKKQDAMFEALQKLKEGLIHNYIYVRLDWCMNWPASRSPCVSELMLLGFISLLLTVFQGLISNICIPDHLSNIMLPCKMETQDHQTTKNNGRRLLAEQVSNKCSEVCSMHTWFTKQRNILLVLFSLIIPRCRGTSRFYL